MSETFKPGDRVTIQGVLHPIARPHIGRRGTVVAVDSSGTYVVTPDGASPIRVYATEVKSAKDQSDYTTVTPGDRVRIVQALTADGRGRASIGKVGVLKRFVHDYVDGSSWLSKVSAYAVDVDGTEYLAAAVEPAPADTPAEPAPASYTVRLQAAKDASAILGEHADETEIEMLGEWLLNERPVALAKPVREPIDDQTFTGWYERLGAQPARSFFIANADTAPTEKPGSNSPDITKAQLIAGEPITIRNLDVELDTSFNDNDVVEVGICGRTTYLDDDINELVDYLRAAQVVQAARRAASES